jgi:RNA polymerase sigma factor (sigma-70 family)
MEEKEILELLPLIRQGSDVAFSELVNRYTPMMNKEVSDFSISGITFDEMFSEACIALHTAAIKYDLMQNTVTFGLFAKICVHRKLIDLSRTHHVPEFSFDVDRIPVTPSIDSRLAEAERFDSLLSLSKSLLSDFEYDVLLLHVQGYKTARIAEFLSSNAKSIDNAKNRIFRKLRTYFSEHKDI